MPGPTCCLPSMNSLGVEVAVVIRECLISAIARMAMSRAVVIWPGSGRPLALRNWRGAHAEPRRRLGHALGESRRRAGDQLAERRRHVVGRVRDQGLDALLDRDRLAGAQAELGLRHRAGMLGERDRRGQGEAAGFQLLEDDVKRHHLGERGGIPGGAGVAFQQRLARDGVDHDVGAGLDGAGGRGHGGDLGARRVRPRG